MADSPMDRAIRALAYPFRGRRNVEQFIGVLADLRTSDPDAFAAVLAECGVVEDGLVDDQGNHYRWLSQTGIEAYDAHHVYRVKRERSTGEGGEDAS